MSGPEVEALLAAPVGRAVLAELIGLDPFELLAELGKPMPAGVTRLMSTTARPVGRPGQVVLSGHGRTAADVIGAAVAKVDLGKVAGCSDRLLLLAVVARVLEGQQAAAGADLAAAGTALLPVAQALAAAPAARWWWEPVNRSGQRWIGAEGSAPPRGAAVAEAIRRTAAEEEREEELEKARVPPGRFWHRGRKLPGSGTWWSAPLGGTVFTTTGPIDVLPAVGLACVEDSAGEDVAEVWAVEVDQGARVREIGGTYDWAQLTAEFPRDVTASRRYDWNEWTGQSGPWVLPNWPTVARDWDGIHLSVGATSPPADSPWQPGAPRRCSPDGNQIRPSG